jgi:D-sedoheptulose 7-phosphate isomerase
LVVAELSALVARHPVLAPLEETLDEALSMLSACYRDGGMVLVCGNGGSAADAEHISAELMKGMTRRRPITEATTQALRTHLPADLAGYLAENLEEALPTVSLSGQTSLLTAISNDTAGDMTFAQQVYGYGRPGDVLWALSTSGRSRNVVLAAATAKAMGLRVLALTGEPGRPLGEFADIWVRVPESAVAAVQELHLPIYHALCGALEEAFFSVADPLEPGQPARTSRPGRAPVASPSSNVTSPATTV